MKIETAVIAEQGATSNLINSIIDNFSDRDEFIILSKGGQKYIQTSGDTSEFIVEYREGSQEEHWTAEKKFNQAELKEMFLLYFNCDDSYKSKSTWRKTF